MHFVYILKCADDTLYTGYTTDVERRVLEHNGESTKSGARYTRARRPVSLVFTKSFPTRSEATKFEAVIKKLSRDEKQNLIANYKK